MFFTIVKAKEVSLVQLSWSNVLQAYISTNMISNIPAAMFDNLPQRTVTYSTSAGGLRYSFTVQAVEYLGRLCMPL